MFDSWPVQIYNSKRKILTCFSCLTMQDSTQRSHPLQFQFQKNSTVYLFWTLTQYEHSAKNKCIMSDSLPCKTPFIFLFKLLRTDAHSHWSHFQLYFTTPQSSRCTLSLTVMSSLNSTNCPLPSPRTRQSGNKFLRWLYHSSWNQVPVINGNSLGTNSNDVKMLSLPRYCSEKERWMHCS